MQIAHSIPFISRSRTIFPFYRVEKLSFQLTTEPSFIKKMPARKKIVTLQKQARKRARDEAKALLQSGKEKVSSS